MPKISASELERREKISAAVKKRYDTPGVRERASAISKSKWDRPGYRENMKKKVQEYWETPGAREKRGEVIKKAFQERPEALISKGKAMKAHWDSPDYRAKMKVAMQGKGPSGERSYRWKGGRKICTRGYIKLMAKAHPYADIRGYVSEGRLVVEKAIGRYLKPTEVVHHLNGITDDNRNCNLVACQDQSYHIFLHWRSAGGLTKGGTNGNS